MEFPRRAVIAERVLAAALLAAALMAAWAEGGSTLAASVRENRPWLAWVQAKAPGQPSAPQLAVYEPTRRRLSLLYIPDEPSEESAAERVRALSPEPLPAVSARLSVGIPPTGPDDEPSVEAAYALKSRSRSLRAWSSMARQAARGLRAGDAAALDPLLFALELRRVPLSELRPARLPDDAQAPALLGRMLSGQDPPDNGRPIVAEVINGAGEPRLASRAAKMLRLSGIDVLATGTARPRARTLVYDRVGDFRRAVKVLAALDCPSGRAVVHPDLSRAVDVSVELGEDCAGAFGRDPGTKENSDGTR